MATAHDVSLTATSEAMADAAGALLGALDATQQAKAQLAFEGDERNNWHYTPPANHGGITLGELSSAQQRLVHKLVTSGVSLRGYSMSTSIMAIEPVLGAIEDSTLHPEARIFERDPGLYHVSIFGEPGGDAPWGWRFQGHHISLNYTLLADGQIASLPTFFGSNPAKFGAHRPLADEEDLARELLMSLDDDQRAIAVISSAAPEDIVTFEHREIADGQLPALFAGGQNLTQEERDKRQQERRERMGLTAELLAVLAYSSQPRGLAASAMDPDQRDKLASVIGAYIDRLPQQIAEFEWQRLERGGIDRIHFAWGGPSEPDEPHYYRLQAPRFLIEYDNTQNDANHIHSVWRDPENDFGATLLRDHYAEAH